MTKCSTVDVETRCGSLEVTNRNRNSVEVTTRRPRGTVTLTKTVTNTAVIDDPARCCSSAGVAQSYVHNQTVPLSTWVVHHNLSFRPAVSIVSSSGDLVHGDVQYTTAQQITINFSAPFSGSVYLS